VSGALTWCSQVRASAAASGSSTLQVSPVCVLELGLVL
jgi:hypothetical protein